MAEFTPIDPKASDANSRHCPSCGASIVPEAVLCVACGYHLKRGHHLATIVDGLRDTTSDQNPYASSEIIESDRSREPPVFDLTDAGARRAKAVVSDAQFVVLTILLASCVCAPAWLVMLPWYSYRLFCWHGLNSQFAELRSPNAFSPHGELAVQFKDAHGRLLIGIFASFVIWTLVAFVVALDLLDQIGR